MHVKLYRKKIESVRAVCLTLDSVDEAARWCGGRRVQEKDPFDEERITVGLNIPTLEGVKRASEGDYIIQDFEGGFRILGGPEFDRLYERPSRN